MSPSSSPVVPAETLLQRSIMNEQQLIPKWGLSQDRISTRTYTMPCPHQNRTAWRVSNWLVHEGYAKQLLMNHNSLNILEWWNPYKVKPVNEHKVVDGIRQSHLSPFSQEPQTTKNDSTQNWKREARLYRIPRLVTTARPDIQPTGTRDTQ